MTIGELTYSLGAVWDKKSLDNIKGGLESIAKDFTASVGLITVAMGAMFATSKKYAELNDEIGKTAKNRDIAIDSYEALKYTFEGAGIAGEKVQDVLKTLQDQKGQVAQGKGDIEAFALLGIDPNSFKTNEALFMSTVDKLNEIKDKSIQADLSKRLLGSQDLGNFLEGGTKAIIEQKKELKELGLLASSQDYENSANFNDTLLKTMTILNGYAKKVFSELMPIFSKLMGDFNSFLKANGSLIRSGLKQFLDYAIASAKFFIALLGDVIDHLGGVKTVAIGLASIFAIWQLPLIIAIGSVVALMLAFDDLMNFIKGKESVIGDLLSLLKDTFETFKADFPNLGKIVEAQLEIVIGVFRLFKESIFSIWDLITGKINFVTLLTDQVDSLKTLLDQIVGSFIKTFSSIGDIIRENLELLKIDFPNLGKIVEAQLEIVIGVFRLFKESIFSIWDLITGKINFVTLLTDQVDSLKTLLDQIVGSFIKSFSSIGDIITNSIKSIPFMGKALEFFGTSTTIIKPLEPQVVTVPANPTNPSNSTYNYNINANVNANSKNVGEVIKEITHPSGY